MAEIDLIGLAAHPVCATPSAVIQNDPSTRDPRVVATNFTQGAKNAATTGFLEARQRAGASRGPPTDPALSSSSMSGSTGRSLRATPDSKPPN
jgi:hypothetical protein